MEYADLDQRAAVSDLIAFSGKIITVGGVNVKAYVEQDSSSYSAGEFGLDNRDESIKATLTTRGLKPIDFMTPVIYKGKKYRVTQIDPSSDEVTTLSLSND